MAQSLVRTLQAIATISVVRTRLAWNVLYCLEYEL